MITTLIIRVQVSIASYILIRQVSNNSNFANLKQIFLFKFENKTKKITYCFKMETKHYLIVHI